MKYIVGNWKMNGLRREGEALARRIAELEMNPEITVIVCPPYTLLGAAHEWFEGSRVALGAQDCHTAEKGAHTGDISAPMLADMGCRYVILGHSERRADHAEGDALVSRKAEAAAAAGLTPIICVGETLAEREAGRTAEVLVRQAFRSIPESLTRDVMLAYEPVWAIGSGKTPAEDEIEAAQKAIRQALQDERGLEQARLSVLYGGSVKAGNAGRILALPSVDGVLVGGASLIADEFCAIAAALD